MFGLEILDIGIGLIVVYLVFSLVCTAANELVASITNARAKTLRRGVETLLTDTGFENMSDHLFGHSLIRSLVETPKGPSYIPSKTFASAMLDMLAPPEPGKQRTWEDIVTELKKWDDARKEAGDTGGQGGVPSQGDLRMQTLRVLMDRAEGRVDALEKEIGDWFDSAMDRVSAWYKRKTQWVVLAIGVAVAGFANADTVEIVNSLSRDSALREALVAQAEAYAAQDDLGAPGSISDTMEEIQALGIPLGWDAPPADGTGWLMKILGLALTAFALSLGAPFWFDLLKKAINIRSVGLNPSEIDKQKAKEAGGSA